MVFFHFFTTGIIFIFVLFLFVTCLLTAAGFVRILIFAECKFLYIEIDILQFLKILFRPSCSRRCTVTFVLLLGF